MGHPASGLVGRALEPSFLAAIEPIRPEMVSVHPAPRILRRMWGPKTAAMTIGSRVFVDPAVLERGGPGLVSLLRHEMVHTRQWKERGAWGFASRYLRQYLLGRVTGASHEQAYRAIEAECEARRLSGH